MDLLEWLISKRKSLDSPAQHWRSWWQELGDYVSPRKAQITEHQVYPDDSKHSILYDSTAVQANMTLAQGQLSLVTPMEESWFILDAPWDQRHIPESKRWYGECTEIMRYEIANSNFYSEVMEAYLDRGGFGTCDLSLQEGWDERSCLNYRAHNVGSFLIEENASGYIDTNFSCRRMSARQIADEFGDEDLPPKIRQALNDPKKLHQLDFVVHHAVFPRGQAPGESRVESSPFYWDMKWSSYHWVEEPDKHLLRKGGFASNPHFVSRYLKWGDDPYGWCPGWAALPEARQLNYLERMLDTLAEIAAFPRLLIPANMVEDVDLGPGGMTIWNQFQQGAKPEEWASQGRYDVGLDRAERKRKAIQEAYHVDLFKMFASMERPGQMTAREVAERSAEKIIQFSPTFARLTTELLTPLLHRTFAILHTRGKFTRPPMNVMRMDRGGVYVPFPEVVYVSKLALAIRTMQNTSFMSLLEAVTPMIQLDPGNLRYLNIGRTIQGLAKNFGVPNDWLATADEVAASEQAMAQQAQMQQAQAGMETAGKLPPEMIDKLAGVLDAAA